MITTRESWLDERGNTWHKSHVSREAQKTLDVVRHNWVSVNEEAIAAAKTLITSTFGCDASGTRGMACADFIYLFGNDGCSHFFVCTNPKKDATALKYEGECDMSFSPTCDFDTVMVCQVGALSDSDRTHEIGHE